MSDLQQQKVQIGVNDLGTTYPEIAGKWHPEPNSPLTPQMVTAGNHKKVWWQCAEGHIWKAVIYSRAGPQKCGYPVCSGKIKESKQIRYGDIMAERLENK